jgi:zinc finger SWIM domain-containing protein 3
VLRNFRREITPEKLGITPGENIRALEILQNIAYSRSEEEYQTFYDKLSNELPYSIVSYFNRNWHAIRSERVSGLKDGVNLGNRTHNRIESINDKVKFVLSHHSSLPEFAENILIAFNSLRTERDHKTVNMFQKKPVNAFDRQSEENKYQELLTPYALTYVLKQMSNRVDVELKEEDNEEHEQQWYAESTEGKVLVNSSCCTCTFYKSIPCRHMFKLREVKQ